MRLTGFRLKTGEPDKALAFYTQLLGAKDLGVEQVEGGELYSFSFADQRAVLEFFYPQDRLDGYRLGPKDNYWKYSLFVGDIRQACQRLSRLGASIGEPFQFGDIGYLAHTADRENYQIELIQKTFQGRQPLEQTITQDPLGELPVLGLLTIRTKDPVKVIAFYETLFEMKLQVRMYVDRGSGFTLYFLGPKDLEPSSPDIDALENREWMYQQKELFLEIQHYWGSEYEAGFELEPSSSKELGFEAICFRGDLEALKARLKRGGVEFCDKEGVVSLKSPDHHEILVRA